MRVLLALLAALLAGVPVAHAQQPPRITAPSAILVETTTGDVVFEKDADTKRPIASTTKMMTALVALDRLKLSQTLVAPRYKALPAESKLGLRAGERMTVADLLRALLLPSANDAAAALAQGASGSTAAFVRAMNARARAMGLRETRFANPVGLDEPNAGSTARELVVIARALLENPFARRVVNRGQLTLESGDHPRTIVNRNRLVREGPAYVRGVKTGRTLGAGYVLVGAARRKDGVGLISVVMGADSELQRDEETLALMRYGLGLYRRETAVQRGTPVRHIPVRFRRGADVELVIGRSVRRVVKKGTRFTRRVLALPHEVEGPLRRGDQLGRMEVFQDGRRIATVPLVTGTDVPEAGVGIRLKEFFTRPWTVVLVLAVLACTVQLLLLRQRALVRARRTARQEVETA